MKRSRPWLFVALGLLSAHCATSKPPMASQVAGADAPAQPPSPPPVPGVPPRAPSDDVPPPAGTSPGGRSACALKSVHFEFNRALLSAEARDALQEDADCLRARGFPSMTIEGNCDERGTSEFNLVLGLRRAERVRKYLVDLGVPASSLTVKTLGKEQPVCGEASEACWARCRRADVVEPGRAPSSAHHHGS